MSERYRTIKIRATTYRALKVLAAQHDETLMDLVDRLARSDTNSDTKPEATPDTVSHHKQNTASEPGT